ncbi:hypothetical protein CW304_13115 [Bacillus sp. UFRGS-B20]|nr:hypothetical protein CW304_13115 [Bacillus sp. UFRGS-B20]
MVQQSGNLSNDLVFVGRTHDIVLVQRNAIKSILNAFKTAEQSHFLDPGIVTAYNVPMGGHNEIIKKAIGTSIQMRKALILTPPDYYVMGMDLEASIAFDMHINTCFE